MELRPDIVVAAGFALNALVVVVGGAMAYGGLRQRMEDHAMTTSESLLDVRKRLANLVSTRECEARHRAAVEAVEGVRREIDSLRR